ncbi:MAG: RNA methyltransferase [Syntrophales bacterium]|nr:RNA methyltransferase [Syntrophales bacterium]
MESRGEFAIALIHYPVYNRKGEICTTSVVNVDIHDLSRLGRTYGAIRFYVVTPLEAQRELVLKLMRHWTEGYGARFNPSRAEALLLVEVKPGLDDCVEHLESITGARPYICVTGAGLKDDVVSYEEMKEMLKRGKAPFLLVFGTGWGLADEVVRKAHYRLAPVEGVKGFNHLSVRCAAAIILDRLFK